MRKLLLPIATALAFYTASTALWAEEDIIIYTQTTDLKYADYHDSYVAKRARQNWILNCMGCHKIDGSGHKNKSMPDLRNQVAQLLHAPGGREYLSRVPGITNTALSDQHLAELIDWVLISFDPENIPANHQPYQAEEVRKWRKQPLTTTADAYRQELINYLSEK